MIIIYFFAFVIVFIVAVSVVSIVNSSSKDNFNAPTLQKQIVNYKEQPNDFYKNLTPAQVAELKDSEVTFGKFKGRKWSAITQSYLKWMIRADHKYVNIAHVLLRYQ